MSDTKPTISIPPTQEGIQPPSRPTTPPHPQEPLIHPSAPSPSPKPSAPKAVVPPPSPPASAVPPKPSTPRFEIINNRSNPVRVLYRPAGEQKDTSLVVPIQGLRHGEYPPEVLDAPHFKDLISAQVNALRTRIQRE